MEVEQSTGHIFQDRALQCEWDIWHILQEVVQAGLQSLHDQQRKLSPWEEAEPKELCDVRVPEVGHQLALPQVLADHLRHTLIFHIQESFMYFLASTDGLLVYDLWRERSNSWRVVLEYIIERTYLLYRAKGACSKFPTSSSHIRQDKLS